MNEYFARFEFRRPADWPDRNREYDCYESFYFYPTLTTPIVFYDSEAGAHVVNRCELADW